MPLKYRRSTDLAVNRRPAADDAINWLESARCSEFQGRAYRITDGQDQERTAVPVAQQGIRVGSLGGRIGHVQMD
jgi:hypothetical protein